MPLHSSASSLDLISMDLISVANAIASKQLSSYEVTSWCLNRLNSFGKALKAVFWIDHENALHRAKHLDEMLSKNESRGSLHGVPLAHKDIFSVAGQVRHVGSKILRGSIMDQDAHVIDLLNQAGQVNLGSLHMAEFALSPTGFNGHYGHALNPWNTEYCPGGSSSGSGIAVAARLVFGSLGSDTGGSIRHPSAMCGVTGLKTTRRLIGDTGSFPLSMTLDCIGPIAQTSRDCARLLSHLVNEPKDYETNLDGDLNGIRIGVPHQYYRDFIDAQVNAALQESLSVLKERGATIVHFEMNEGPSQKLMQKVNSMMAIVMSFEAATLHQDWLKSRPEDYAEQVRLRIEPGFNFSEQVYFDAISSRLMIQDEFLYACGMGLKNQRIDVVHVPTLQIQTPTISQTTVGSSSEILSSLSKVTHNTRGVNYLGLPAISVPAGFSSAGLPMAFQLIGRAHEEALLLKIADAYQSETSWHQKIPTLTH